jgi:hypothetical protein
MGHRKRTTLSGLTEEYIEPDEIQYTHLQERIKLPTELDYVFVQPQSQPFVRKSRRSAKEQKATTKYCMNNGFDPNDPAHRLAAHREQDQNDKDLWK